jgi:DNA polymerase I-like protein with 3'-5' exonuclease and polymerase domains
MSIGPTKVIPSSVYREAANFPMQGGVADILNLTVVEMIETLPYLKLVYTMHDSMWMECPIEREADVWPVYKRIVQQPRNIHGVMVPFPGSFKRVTTEGREEKVK